MGRTTKRCRQSFGKRKRGRKIISDYQKSIKKTREELADKIENKTAAVLWVTNNSAFMVSKNRSSGRIVYDDLEFGVPDLVEEVSKKPLLTGLLFPLKS